MSVFGTLFPETHIHYTPGDIKTKRSIASFCFRVNMHLRVREDSVLSVHFLIQLLSFLRVLLIGSTGDVVVRLFSGEIQHERARLVRYGDSAGPLGPGLPIHLHRHHGALQNPLQCGNEELEQSPSRNSSGRSSLTTSAIVF